MDRIEIILYRTQSWKHLKCELSDNKLSITRSDLSESESKLINGFGNIINTNLLAVFSHSGKNYLYLKDKLVVLTKDISIQYYCEQSHEQTSWIKLFNNNHLIYETEYKNGEEPYIDIASGFDDWDAVNFAHYLAGYINKARENPDIVLFP